MKDEEIRREIGYKIAQAGMHPEYFVIRPETIEAIWMYVRYGFMGDFTQALMENNLSEALGRADEGNRGTIWPIVKYLYNEVPAFVKGDKARVKEHVEACAKKREEENAKVQQK